MYICNIHSIWRIVLFLFQYSFCSLQSNWKRKFGRMSKKIQFHFVWFVYACKLGAIRPVEICKCDQMHTSDFVFLTVCKNSVKSFVKTWSPRLRLDSWSKCHSAKFVQKHIMAFANTRHILRRACECDDDDGRKVKSDKLIERERFNSRGSEIGVCRIKSGMRRK